MVQRVSTVAFEGIEARAVDVQVQVAPGLPAFNIVGLPDKAVSEAKERVRAALVASGLALPARRIVRNQEEILPLRHQGRHPGVEGKSQNRAQRRRPFRLRAERKARQILRTRQARHCGCVTPTRPWMQGNEKTADRSVRLGTSPAAISRRRPRKFRITIMFLKCSCRPLADSLGFGGSFRAWG